MNTAFSFLHSINSNKSLETLKQEILNKDKDFFTFDFRCVINEDNDIENISIDNFWKLAKIKAKKVSLFVDEILSCEVLEPAPLGFIREITMPGADVTQVNGNQIVRIKERVVVDDKTKTLLFFQLEATGKILLYAINQVTEENNNVYFSGHYVYSVQKDSTDKDDKDFMEGSKAILPLRIRSMIQKMKAFAKSDEFEKTFKQLYPTQVASNF